MAKNAFYAQSGGVTAVINATASGVLKRARQYPDHFDTVYAGQHGILGALHENLIDTSHLTHDQLTALEQCPGGAFGSCRYKLKSLEENRAEYQRLIEVFAAHDIQYFLYNGGGDSQDTAHKVSQMSKAMGHAIQCIGIPKTIDNDLAITDNCPGFGSVAKYIATSTIEASMDVMSMAATSTKVFILEVMGRHTGWIAASGALAQDIGLSAPHIILFPERPLDQTAFVNAVHDAVKQYGYCTIVAAEGVKDQQGEFLAKSNRQDAFGHAQLGGMAPVLAQMVQKECGYKVHYAVADYLQRSARHLASKCDLEQAVALGQAAVDALVAGKNAIMPTIIRKSDTPYAWAIGEAPLSEVANVEKTLPDDFIREDGMHVSEAAKTYLRPLIQGEAPPPYANGLPAYMHAIDFQFAKKQCPAFTMNESS